MNHTVEDAGEAATLLELSKHVDRAFPTLSKFASFKQLWQWYTAPLHGQSRSPKDYEDVNDASWRRGRSNSKRWSEHRALLLLIERRAEEMAAQQQQQESVGEGNSMELQTGHLRLAASEALDAEWALQLAAKGGVKGGGTLSTYFKLHMKSKGKGPEGDGEDPGGAAAGEGAAFLEGGSGSYGLQGASRAAAPNSAAAFAASMSAFAAAVEAASASHAAPDAAQGGVGAGMAPLPIPLVAVEGRVAGDQAHSNSTSTGAADDGDDVPGVYVVQQQQQEGEQADHVQGEQTVGSRQQEQQAETVGSRQQEGTRGPSQGSGWKGVHEVQQEQGHERRAEAEDGAQLRKKAKVEGVSSSAGK